MKLKTELGKMLKRIAKRDSKAQIWWPSNVYKTAKLGKGVSVGMFSEVGHNVVIGDGSRIGMGAFICEGVSIGKNVFIGPGVKTINDRYPRVGKSKSHWEKTIIEDGVSIGANATIMCGITLKKGCMIAAGAVVIKSVPPCEIWGGVPAKKIGLI